MTKDQFLWFLDLHETNQSMIDRIRQKDIGPGLLAGSVHKVG